MNVARKVIAVVAALALSVTFVMAGVAACTFAPVTHVLANFFSDDATSPFSRTQLVQVAEATRDYSFGSHDKLALYRTIYDVDRQYERSILDGGGKAPDGFPALENASGTADVVQLGAVFANASEMYCYSPATISHLDDCYAVASAARIAGIVLLIVAVVGLVASGMLGRKRVVGAILMAAGTIVVVALAGLAVWAALDFTGFFAAFHGLLFAQGNWTFPYDSLLICALPTGFWVGMGVVWLVVSVVLSILSIAVGAKVRKRS